MKSDKIKSLVEMYTGCGVARADMKELLRLEKQLDDKINEIYTKAKAAIKQKNENKLRMEKAKKLLKKD